MKTFNYEMFGFMQTNRDLRDSHIEHLMSSITELGYITALPVIVDESMIIIDGQHRFEACKRLGIPIYYEVSYVDKEKAKISLNMNQRIWRLEDYIGSWAKSGKQCYIELLEFENRYKLGISNSIVICHAMNGRRANDIRKGKEFIVNPKRHEIAQFIFNCKPYFSFYKNKNFISSIERLFAKTSIKNVNKVFDRIQPLKQQVSVSDYLSIYENYLNRYKKNDDERISLF